MFYAREHNNSFKIIFSSEYCLVTNALILSKKYLTRYDISEDELEKVGAILRELFVNAFEHGNNKIEDKIICCSIEFCGWDMVKISVLDEGEGFNYSSVNAVSPKNSYKHRSRGYALINSISDRLEFNDKGNRITAYLRVSKESVIYA